MVKRYRGSYHLLVAQNYLGSLKSTSTKVTTAATIDINKQIRLSTAPLATSESDLSTNGAATSNSSRAFSYHRNPLFVSHRTAQVSQKQDPHPSSSTSRPEYPRKTVSCPNTVRSTIPRKFSIKFTPRHSKASILSRQSTSTEPLTGYQENVDYEAQPVRSKKRTQHATPKRSIFARISRIVSADEMIPREEEVELRSRDDDERPGSPASTKEGFTFLQRLKQTLARTESSERVRHTSSTYGHELRPFDFRDEEHELTFSNVLGGFYRPRTQTMDGGLERSPKAQRRSSALGGSLLAVDTLNHPTQISRASSCDPEVAKIRETVEEETDDLIEETPYSPEVFEKFEDSMCRQSGTPGFMSNFSLYRSQDEAKRDVNEQFRLRFPQIHLTHTKFKSIKKELKELAISCDLDASTLATALVYFERIVLKGQITKFNRKLVAGACLIVAVKVTDVGRMKIRDVVEEVESRLRESRRELLSYELPLCVALDFELLPAECLLRPHLDKIYFGII